MGDKNTGTLPEPIGATAVKLSLLSENPRLPANRPTPVQHSSSISLESTHFNRRLELALCEVTDAMANRPIVMGRFELMQVAYPHIGQQNPDELIAVDRKSRLWAVGGKNCITCQHFTQPGDPCPAWADHGRPNVELDQSTAYWSSNRCGLQALLPGLGTKTGTAEHPSAMFHTITLEVSPESGDNIVMFQGGRYTLKKINPWPDHHDPELAKSVENRE